MNQTTKEPLLPQLGLFQMITGHYLSRAIYVAAKLGIADLLNRGPQHYDQLAKATETLAPSLNRLLRLLAAAGVFAEKVNGRFELTPIGEWLRSNLPASHRASALLFAGPMPDDADSHILKSVIHDWDDERSIAILKNCHRAMPPHGKLLLVEIALATRIVPSAANLIAAGGDVNMLVNVGGRERTELEFRALFEAAGFKLTRIIPTESLVSVLEGAKQ